MALIALSTFETEDYVSDRDPAKTRVDVPSNPLDKNSPKTSEVKIDMANATVFELAGLDVATMAGIQDRAMNMAANDVNPETGMPNMSVKMQINETNIEAVRFGLRGWRNFKDAKGKEIKFAAETLKVGDKTYQIVAPECMDRLDVGLVQELANQIKERSQVTKDLEGN